MTLLGSYTLVPTTDVHHKKTIQYSINKVGQGQLDFHII